MFSGPAQGLWYSPNPFSQTPAGTLKTADNVRFTAPGIIEPRRGFDTFDPSGFSFGSAASRADAMAFYAGSLLAAYDLTSVSLYTSATGFVDFTGTFEPVGNNRMRFEGAARSVFFNTSQGLKAWDGVGYRGQPVPAGNPLGLNIEAVNNSDNGWQTANTAVAHRYTICSKDAFGRIIEGPPSGRTTLLNRITAAAGAISRSGTNVQVVTGGVLDPPNLLGVGDVFILSPGETDFPAGAKTVTVILGVNSFRYSEAGAAVSSTLEQNIEIARSADLTIYLPEDDVTELNFIRVYRSLMTADADDTPSDEMFQCFESGYLTATDISNGYIVVNDTAPESQIDVPLYTNENTGAGALQANYQPPSALDIVYWAQRMWFANTANKHSLKLSLIGVGAPDGVQNGDTVTIVFGGGPGGDVTLTATDSNLPPGADEFFVYTFFDPGLNIQLTAQDFCRAFNASASNVQAYAYYVSSEGGQPGSILLVSRTFGDASSMQVWGSRGSAWTPQLPDSFSSPDFPLPASDDNAHPAGLFYSRLGQPEAVPPVNFELVNSDNDEILRIFPLHYRLLIFKTDGIYTCTNVLPFSIQKLSAFVLLAPDSVCVLEDRVYALTDQGIVTISDAGVVQISNPIDDVFNAMMAEADVATLAARSFGMAYRSERQVLLWSPEIVDAAITADNSQAHVFSTEAQGFTRYTFGARCAAIDPDANTMVFAPTDSNRLRVENKSLTNLDYHDVSNLVLGLASAISGADLTFSAAQVALLAVGDVLTSLTGGGAVVGDYYPITAIDGLVVTLSGAPGWVANSTALALFPAIECGIEFNKLTAGTPADLKMVGQVSLLFRTNGVHETTATFSSEIQTDPEDVTLSAVGWGEFSWGEVPYGSPARQLVRVEPIPPQAAQCAQLSVGFSTRQAMAKFGFLGIDIVEAEDTPVNRG